VRRRVPGMRVVCGGVALERLQHGWGEAHVITRVALSVGLAGALDPALEPGTVVVPSIVAAADGSEVAADRAWTAVLLAASRRLNLPTAGGTMVTTGEIVTGAARATWASRGYLAADMESAAIAGLAPSFAVVRVVLDTPSREISPLWTQPLRAAVRPRLWAQGVWLMRAAPRFALRAADVLAEALRGEAVERDVHPKV